MTRTSNSSGERTDWHLAAGHEVVSRLGSDAAEGLSRDEARRRLERHGPNELPAGVRRTPLGMFLAQFGDVMILVLLAAAALSGALGELADTVAILVIVFLNAVVGAIQEYRAERALGALRELSAPQARVLREGSEERVPAGELVPGDVVLLEAGNVVAADHRLLRSTGLRLDESALTGESQPVEKHERPLAGRELSVGDRLNMAYRGTLVTQGRGTGVVVATGTRTELGRIAGLLHGAARTQTPLQRRLAALGRKLALAVLVVCAVIFLVGLLRGEEPLVMLLTSISLAVAAVPEALPAVVTVSLALGARKMIRKSALVRRLPAVESLGSVTYVCADKTGTLTQNRMQVGCAYRSGARRGSPLEGADGRARTELGRALALNNDAVPEAEEGDPTELALLAAAVAGGFEKASLEQELPRIDEIPFAGERRRMTTLHRAGEGVLAYVKGAPEAVLPLCRDALLGDAPEALDADEVLAAAESMAAEGFRVLAFAFRRLEDAPDPCVPADVESGLTFLGLVGLLDPPREGAAESVALCRSAGIEPVMITGDHPATARAIARRLGIGGEDEVVLVGEDLARLSAEELQASVRTTRVYARVSPEQKIDLVRALQADGEFVAMTGDGVNDAPALRQAEIGIAMGRGGTEVAREAADMVLLDDDFTTIVAAVREGRRVFDNIRKFVRYTLTSNSGEIWTLFLAPFFGLPIPLIPIQILWINLVTDGLPGLALAAEPEERGVMQRPPRPPRESIFAGGMGRHIVGIGLLIAALSIGAQGWAYASDSPNWQSVVFTMLTFCQLAHVMAIRSEGDSLFRIGLFSNLPLLGAVLLTVVLQLLVVYVPWLNPVFHTSPLSAVELLVCLVFPALVVGAVELEKLLARRRRGKNPVERRASSTL